MFRKQTKTRKYKGSYEIDYETKPKSNFQGLTTEDQVKVYLSDKAMRNLPKSSYALQASPYESSLPESNFYRILAPFNKTIGGSYRGLRNIDGGNTSQYANSVISKFLACADFITTNIRANYRMLPININLQPKVSSSDYAGLLLIDEMRKSIAESASVLQSTTFTQMAINNFGIVTDMPMGSATPTSGYVNTKPDGTTETVSVYTELTDVLYASLIFYQIVLQSSIQTISWNNAARLKMGTMIRREWNRSVPKLNALFGMFKKSSYISFLQSLCLSFEGEYVDLDEMAQLNMLSLTPSAKSDAIIDPVKELKLKLNYPSNFKIVLITDSVNKTCTELFSLDNDLTVTYKTNVNTTASANIFELNELFVDKMSSESIMKWARSSSSVTDATSYFDKTKYVLDGINLAMTNFKTKMNDIREVLDVMTRTGAINWKKGFRPSITKETDAEIPNNMIINDIYRIKSSSATEVVFDSSTKRWRTYTLWDKFTGIPEFDAYQGGAFLTLSLKAINFANDDDKVHQYLPIRFTSSSDPDDDRLFAICRDGIELIIENGTPVQMSTDAVLSRLVPLNSQASLKIKIPSLASNDSSGTAVDTAHKSAAYRMITEEFGLAQITLVNNTDISLDPSIVAIYEIELEDITNEAITYARSNAPFRGTSSTVDILGFNQTKVEHHREEI